MTTRQRLLVAVVLLELLAAVAAVGWRLSRPVPPQSDLGRLDADSLATMRAFHAAAASGSAAAWEQLGDACLGNGFFPDAEVCYRHVLERDPRNITSLYGLALCLSRTGRTAEAIDQFRRFVQVAGAQHSDAAAYQVGRCYLREEDAADAESAFRRVTRLPEAEMQLARLLVRTGRAAEAQSLIDNLLHKYPHALHVLELAMHSAQQSGREREAARYEAQMETADYMFAMSLDVSDVENYRRRAGFRGPLGFSMTPPGSDQPTSTYTQLAPQIDRNPPWYQRRLLLPAAAGALAEGRPEIAIQLLDQLFEHSQVTPQALIVYGDAHRALQRPDEAERAWQHSLRLRPTADAHRRLAQRYEELAQVELQRRHSALASQYTGIDAYRARRFETAIAELEAAVALDADLPRSWLYLGKSRVRTGRTREAAAAFQRCLELSPHDADALASIAELAKSGS